MVLTERPIPLKHTTLFTAIAITLLSNGFVLATNSPLAWLGLFCFLPYAAYQCHQRLTHPKDRYYFLLSLWVFLGLPFTLNALYGSLWWLAYWPVTFGYILIFSLINADKN